MYILSTGGIQVIKSRSFHTNRRLMRQGDEATILPDGDPNDF